MSIVVTCSCTKTYRLPNRYAGKRCRCRDCGRKIAVPPVGAVGAEAAVEEPAKAEKKRERRRKRQDKRRDDPSKTTRRLSSQDQEILGERRRLRSSQRTRPVSESMHQLAPMTLSGELSIAPAQPKKAMPRRAEPAPAKPSSSKSSKAKKGTPRPSAKAPARPSKTKVTPKQPDPGSEIEVEAKPPKKAAKTARATKTKKADRKADKNKDKKGKKAQGRRGRTSREDEDAAEGRPALRKRARAYNLPVVLGIAGVLCLGIGLVIGGLLGGASSGAADAKVEQRLAHVDGLKASRQWAAAKTELDALQAELKAAGDDEGLARVRAAGIAVETMVQLAAIEDDETKLATLVDYATNRDAAVRLGVAFELRELAELDDAQQALAALATDPDKRVAEAARHGLVQGGGPLAIPYLGQVIEETAASGHKLGEVALERALEIQEPEIAPVLLIALKARASAPAPVLKAILGRLADFADPSMKDAVTPFASHADEGVKAAAQAILDSIG